MATTLKCPASSGITWRHSHHVSGQPWSRRIGGPEPPVTALILMPFAGTSCWAKPFKAAIMMAFQSDADVQTERVAGANRNRRSEEHTSELQSLMRISYAVFCLKKKKDNNKSILNQH